jgi:hypothetical protein
MCFEFKHGLAVSMNYFDSDMSKSTMTDFPVVNVHVDELSSARIWQHKLCATLSANININFSLCN